MNDAGRNTGPDCRYCHIYRAIDANFCTRCGKQLKVPVDPNWKNPFALPYRRKSPVMRAEPHAKDCPRCEEFRQLGRNYCSGCGKQLKVITD